MESKRVFLWLSWLNFLGPNFCESFELNFEALRLPETSGEERSLDDERLHLSR